MSALRKAMFMVLVAAGALLPGAARAADGDIKTKFVVLDDWGTGFSGEIYLKNSPQGEAQDLKDWRVTIDFEGEISSTWSCLILSQEGTRYILGPKVTATDDNSTIFPGGPVLQIGFNGKPGNPQIQTLEVAGTWIPATKTPTVPETPAYRVNANRDADSFTLGKDEPLQVHVKKDETRTFTFNKPVSKVISRNSIVAAITVENGAIKVKGVSPGRTGMRIAFQDTWQNDLFMGLRVDQADGARPGLPGPVALGSVAQDTDADLNFWINHIPGRKGTRADIRYVYLQGGPISGWAQETPNWATRYAKESMVLGLIPFFVFYNIPNANENPDLDYKNVNDTFYMTEYYKNLDKFLADAMAVMQGELYGVVLEPDFLGYMQKDIKLAPNVLPTADGHLVDTVTKINQKIAAKGGNVLFGWQLNLWADPSINYAYGVIRITDDPSIGWVKGREIIKQAATTTAKYALAAGIHNNGASFIAVDKYGLDAMGAKNASGNLPDPDNPKEAQWFWNNDHWHNYLLYVNIINLVSNKPMVLWQLPVGHINSSTAISARTNSLFPDLPNTVNRYEDSCTTFFFGDAFDVANKTRRDYFIQNQAQDETLEDYGGRLIWGSHLGLLPGNGIIAAMFGAGVGESTTNIGYPPTDNYFWIQKAQIYYEEIGVGGPAYRPRPRLVPIIYLLLD
jgi:hypothetical protein